MAPTILLTDNVDIALPDSFLVKLPDMTKHAESHGPIGSLNHRLHCNWVSEYSIQ